jgi:hypothetical protein
MKNWRDIHYLLNGDERQRQAYAVLEELDLFYLLRAYDPILAGTIPIGIYLPSSDLDIICYASQLQHFAQVVLEHYSGYPGFRLKEKSVRGEPSVVAYFEHGGFGIELFAQAIPTEQQFAFRHMVVEERLLRLHGPAFRQQVIALKQQGYKTEPAFARLLGLTGDPYLQLLEFEDSR